MWHKVEMGLHDILYEAPHDLLNRLSDIGEDAWVWGRSIIIDEHSRNN